MELTLSARQVADAAKRLSPALAPARGTSLPVLTNALVTAHKGAISLRATDLELDLTIGVSGSASGDGKMLLPIRQVAKFAAAFGKDAPITITEDTIGNDSYVRLACDNIKSEVAAGDVKEFPALRRPSKPKTHKIDFDAIGHVLPAVSTDDARPILSGVYVNGDTTVATDSYRLYTCTAKNATSVTDRLLIPHRAARILARIGGIRKVTVTADNNDRGRVLMYQAEGMTLVCNLIDGEFPNWRSLVPDEKAVLMEFDDPEGFVPAVKRMSTLATGLIGADAVPMVFEGDPIEITIESMGTKVSGTFLGKVATKIAFNHRYFSEALTGAKVTTIGGFSHLKPCMIRWEDDTHEHARLIMPVRIS